MNTKLTILLLALIFTTQRLYSQILIGPVVGAQASWASFGQKENKSYFSMKPVYGYHAGLGLSFRVRNRFYLTTSFLYSVKGRIIEGKIDPMLDHHVKYRYIDVPMIYSVDFKGNVGNNNQFKYFLGIGPNISYWLGGKGRLYTSDFNENQLPELEYTIRFNKNETEIASNEMAVESPNRIQLGLNIAAGLVVEPIVNQKFIFQLRYELGHSYFAKEKDGVFRDTYYQDDLQSRNQGIRVSIQYFVDLRTKERKKGKSTIRTKRMQ